MSFTLADQRTTGYITSTLRHLPCPSFFTDDIVWRLICERQFDELDPDAANTQELDELWSRIQAGPRLGIMFISEAVKAFCATSRQPVV